METGRQGSDSGETLVELLLSIVIMGICFAAVLAGIGTSVRASAINHEQAFDSSYSRALAERIEAQTFVPCATASTYTTDGVLPAGSSFSVQVISVETLDAVTNLAVPCSSNAKLQRVTLRVTTPDPRAQAASDLVLLKRSP